MGHDSSGVVSPEFDLKSAFPISQAQGEPLVENPTTVPQPFFIDGGSVWLILGALLALTAVALGAFGAHGLQTYLDELAETDPELAVRRLDNWKTAAHYQLTHALAILISGTLLTLQPQRWWSVAAAAFLAGIVLFSGSLFLLVLTEVRILGAVTPLGGVSLMIGWAALAVGGLKLKTRQQEQPISSQGEPHE